MSRDSRLKFMEDQMGSLQSTLSELVSVQRMMAGPSFSQPHPPPPPMMPQHPPPRSSERIKL